MKNPFSREAPVRRVTFHPVADVAALNAVFAGAADAPVALLLHDPWCPISASAYEEVEAVDGDVFIVDVSEQHDVSKAVEQLTGVRHQSPQMFVLKAGAPLWHASHGRITEAAVSAALEAANG